MAAMDLSIVSAKDDRTNDTITSKSENPENIKDAINSFILLQHKGKTLKNNSSLNYHYAGATGRFTLLQPFCDFGVYCRKK